MREEGARRNAEYQREWEERRYARTEAKGTKTVSVSPESSPYQGVSIESQFDAPKIKGSKHGALVQTMIGLEQRRT